MKPAKRRTHYRELPDGAKEFTASAGLNAGAASSGVVTGGGQTVRLELEEGHVGVVDSLFVGGVTPSGVPVLFFNVAYKTNGAVRAPGYGSIAVPSTGGIASIGLETDIPIEEAETVGVYYVNSDVAAHVIFAVMHGFSWPKLAG